MSEVTEMEEIEVVVRNPSVSNVVRDQPPFYNEPSQAYFGPGSINALCPRCGVYVNTQTKHKSGHLVYLACTGIAMMGGFLGCCLIPFCVDSCKDIQHTCPMCHQTLGEFKRFPKKK
uniref:LITAF domain-containing protein n=1 Tax=Mesocestoides corti TaxID=53468 RepID=A0A5K3FDN6_MESCO